MSYLVCDSCKSYYELQPGELPNDFSDECECGGKLNFKNKIDGLNNEIPDKIVESKPTNEDKQFKKEVSKGYKVKPKTYTANDAAHGIVWIVKVAIFIMTILINILFLIILLPLGILMLLGTYMMYKLFFKN